jgi:hypothetical protein
MTVLAHSNEQIPQSTLHWRNTAFTWVENPETSSKPRAASYIILAVANYVSACSPYEHMNRESRSSALSRLFRNRNSKRQSSSQHQSPSPQPATDVTPGRPSISHPFALAPNTTLANKLTTSSAQFTFTAPTPVTTPIPVPIYRPASASDFLERLSTFKLSTYRDKPTSIDAVAAARCGWRNEGGKDRLACNVCGAGWIVGNTTGMTREAGGLV